MERTRSFLGDSVKPRFLNVLRQPNLTKPLLNKGDAIQAPDELRSET